MTLRRAPPTPDDIYTERLLEHARNPRARTARPPGVVVSRQNRLCGDRVDLGMRIHDDRIIDLGFDADACAVTVAAASLLADVAQGMAVQDTINLCRHFITEGGDGLPEGDDRLSMLRRTFGGVTAFPSRRRCVTLPFEAALGILQATDAGMEEVSSA